MSDRQDEANRRNSQLSTGPRTADGKARVALNALKHGLTGKQVVIPNENPEDFDAFREDLLKALDPHDALQATLAESIVIDAWRLRRIPLLESALYRRGRQESIIANQEREVRRYEYTEENRFMEMGFTKTKVANSDLQTHADASARLKESRSKLDNDLSVEMTILFQRHSETLTNLSRHGTALLRSFQRNLHDLQRLQAIRAGERVAAPAVMDVDVNIRQKGGADPVF